MASFTFEITGVAPVRELIAGIMDRYPRAVREAVNHLVASTRLREIDEIKSVYHSPVPYTTGGVMYRPMRTDADLDKAGVALRGSPDYGTLLGEGTIRYLPPTIEERERRHKPFEKGVIFSAANAAANLIGPGDYLVPGPHQIYFDANGNIKAGIIGKIASDLGFRGATPTLEANRSFFLRKIGNIRGIFERAILNRAGDEGRPLLVFQAVRAAPRYSEIFDFFGVGQQHMESKYAEYFGEALDNAIGR